ncbi:MAG: hypothetical protein KBA02_00065 [Paludibacteraceae bacterium]|nr:hypothetical protein [Paludibacteraceae bacterium]
MNLYNPTADVIKERFNGFMITIGPDETKSVADDCGKHMIKKCGNLGLVSIHFSEKEEEAFGSFKEYKKLRKMEGLNNYKTWIQQCLSQEQVFPREVSQKNGGEVEMSTTKVPYFKNKLKEIEELLNAKEEEKKEKVTNVNKGAVKS